MLECTRVFTRQGFQAAGVPGRHLYSRSEILATDECSRAAHISRVVQTSKQAARAAGGGAEILCTSSTCRFVCFALSRRALSSYLTFSSFSSAAEEFDPEENLHSTDGHSHT